MRGTITLLMIGVLLSGCGAAAGEPEQIVCEVLTWSDPEAVTFSLHAWEFEDELVIDEVLVVEFSYKAGNLYTSVIDTWGGDRDYLHGDSPFSPRPVDPTAMGDVVYDVSGNHVGRAASWRILCKAA